VVVGLGLGCFRNNIPVVAYYLPRKPSEPGLLLRDRPVGLQHPIRYSLIHPILLSGLIKLHLRLLELALHPQYLEFAGEACACLGNARSEDGLSWEFELVEGVLRDGCEAEGFGVLENYWRSMGGGF
jgi:hypothetical protein